MASAIPAEDHLDMFVARESAKFLRRHRGQPFFLCASFLKPHTPLFAPREWAARYPVAEMPLPSPGDIEGYPEHVQRRIRNTMADEPLLHQANFAGYYACLAFVDHCIGVLMDALEQEGLTRNTIVVYTSDHGDMNGQHGLFGKFCLFDPSVKVPLIVSYPAKLPENAVCDALVEQIGLYPTLAALTGTEPVGEPTLRAVDGAPDQISGRSFADLLLDPTQPGPDAAYSEYNLRSRNCQYMIRTERHKYIHNDGSTDELYDLRDDPEESVNLADDPARSAEQSELRHRLFSWYDPATNPFRAR